MALSINEFEETLHALIFAFQDDELETQELEDAIMEESLELVDSINSRDVAVPEYRYGGDQ